MRYDPIGHSLAVVPNSHLGSQYARDEANSLVDTGRATLIGLLAESGKTAAKYKNAKTLVWRDAGVVLGYMSIVAQALKLSFCPLGVTGEPYMTEFLESDALQSAGIALLGSS